MTMHCMNNACMPCYVRIWNVLLKSRWREPLKAFPFHLCEIFRVNIESHQLDVQCSRRLKDWAVVLKGPRPSRFPLNTFLHFLQRNGATHIVVQCRLKLNLNLLQSNRHGCVGRACRMQLANDICLNQMVLSRIVMFSQPHCTSLGR